MDREVKPSRESRPPRQGGREGGRPPRRPPVDEPVQAPVATNGEAAGVIATAVEEEVDRQDVPRAELSGEKLDIRTLKEKSIAELTGIAKALDVPNATALRKQELIFEILRAQTE
jgi:hypothetical protein